MQAKESKICSICNVEKPITEFYKLNKKYYHARCKICYKVKQYTYYGEIKEIVKLKRILGYYNVRRQIIQNEGSSNFND
jgi:hypothetical protein